MRPARGPAFLLLALGIVAVTARADDEQAAMQARVAMQAWTTANLAPRLVARCKDEFPEKASMYARALDRWLTFNADTINRGQDIYRYVTEARNPGRNASDVLNKGIERALAGYAAKSREDRLQHCESAFILLMMEGGPVNNLEPLPRPPGAPGHKPPGESGADAGAATPAPDAAPGS